MTGKQRHKPAVRARIRRAVDSTLVEMLEQRVLLSGGPDFTQFKDGLHQTLSQANTLIAGTMGATALPFVGKQIGSDLTTVHDTITKLDTALASITANSVSSDVTNALTSALGGTVTPVTDTPSLLEYSITRNGALTPASSVPALNFNLGLSSLGLSGNVGLTVSTGYAYTLDFGVNASNGFFLDTSKSSFQLSASVGLTPASSLTGKLGFLQFTATDHTQDTHTPTIGPSLLTANFTANLTAPGNQLTPTNLASASVAMSLAGNAHLALDCTLGFAGNSGNNFPSISSLLTVDWAFPSVTLTTAGVSTADFGNVPEIAFHDASIDLGQAISNLVGPIVNDLYDVLDPIKPIVDFFNSPMPIFNDIGFLKKLVGTNAQGVATVGNFFGFVAQLDGESGVGNAINDFVGAAEQVYTLHDEINTLSGAGKIDLGSFSLGSAGGDTNTDARAVQNFDGVNLVDSGNSAQALQSQITGLLAGNSAATDFENAIFGAPASSAEPTSSDGSTHTFDNNPADWGFKFPVFTNPTSLFGLLIGQNVNLFTYMTPPLQFGAGFDITIPIIGPLVVELMGALSNNDVVQFGGQFAAGYDTAGLVDGSPLDGFYIDEAHSFARIDFGIAADAALDLVIVEVGVGGGLKGDIILALKDPTAATDGGKLRDTQLQNDLNNGPLGMFDVSGEIDAFLNAFVKIGFGPFSITENFDIASITLLTFGTGTAKPPVLGEVDANGMLTLNIGPNSSLQGNGATDGNDTDIISHLSTQADGSETVNVSSQGFTQKFSGVKKIYGEGGTGDNQITIRQNVISSVLLYAGYTPTDDPGGPSTSKNVINDQGSGPATIYGSDGNDQIHVSTGGNAPSMGATVWAGAGTEVIEVDGNLATNEKNYLYGGSGKDTMIGGPGNDYIQAGSGDAVINGAGGNNTLIGGTGNDHFVVGVGDGATNSIAGNASPPAGVVDLLEIDGTSGAETIAVSGSNGQLQVNGQYTTNNAPVTDNVTASGIQALDLEAAPSPNNVTGVTPIPGNINITINALNGSGLQSVYVDMLDSSSGGHLANPVLVTVNGYGNDNASFVGTNATVSTLAGGTAGTPPSEVYAITSTNTAGNLTIVTTDQQNDNLIYNAGNGSNSMTLQNNVVNPGDIVFNSAPLTPGVDTVNVQQAVGSVLINQNGKDQIVNIGSPATGGLPAVQAPVTLAGDVTSTSSPTGYVGTLALNVNDSGDTAPESGQITSGVISGLGLGGNTITYTYASSVNVTLGDGGNTATVAINQDVPTTVSAGLGSDTINASTSTAPVTIIGGTGHDVLTGSNFGDSISGGAGTDLINEGLAGAGAGTNTIGAGDGNDSVVTGIGTDLITLGNGADSVTLGTGNDTLTAGDGNDSVLAGGGNDFLTLGNGRNTVQAGNGKDNIVLGYGNDSVTAGDGNDLISFLYGTDTIHAGNGNDLITEVDGPNASYGNDLITAGNGADTLSLGNGSDTVTVGNGADIINAGNGNDSIFAGNGIDLITLGGGNDSVLAGDGGDRITTGDGNSTISSGAGNDVIRAGAGNNKINSGPGDDIIDIGAGADTVDGGSGNNVLVQQADVDQALANGLLTAGGAVTAFSNIGRVSLAGESANHNFDVSGWTNGGSVQITGGSGTNTVTSSDDTNFTLNNSSLARSDGNAFALSNIQNAILTGGTSSNAFDVSGWTGTATLNGGGGLGVHTVAATNNSNIALTNSALTRPGFGLITLIDIARAILTGSIGNLLLDATGFGGQATLVAGPGNDTLLAGTGGDRKYALYAIP
ncbi:MAG TPA: calcium-binding protein [Tepidisphaeraceae bacterium]|nr:calcium-binding protein [Tepidisphaeraceae bacterium]